MAQNPLQSLFHRGNADRSKTITFRCTEDEYEHLQREAQRLNCSGISDLLRIVLHSTDFNSIQDRPAQTPPGQSTRRPRSPKT